ncbi:MAG TPA: CRTAC1 family protein [Thermoanaerobaculia bacterium]|nr:CRTAC1 family protein [Thermoanaerobaculia bacterium]
MYKQALDPRSWSSILIALALLAGGSSGAGADGGVTFQDIAAGGGAGLEYEKAPSPTWDVMLGLRTRVVMTSEVPNLPLFPWGTPGVVIFDYDRDGDQDLYVTNGPGAGNALFQSQLEQTGELSFVDVAAAAGVSATAQDSFGACAGDIDNDRDLDLLVLGNHESNLFFENQGDGTFVDRTVASGLGGGNRTHISCSMGDVDNDGYLDVAISNGYDNWSHQLVVLGPFAYNEHNQLFKNQQDGTFTDVSAASGIEDLSLLPPQVAGSASLSWVVAIVDYDLDGDADIIFGDDQELPLPTAAQGGVDLGLLRVFQNDGSGQFTDVSAQIGTAKPGVWMGLSFGDFNCDGALDIFATNGGDYVASIAGAPRGAAPSEWFLGSAAGTFTIPGVGALLATPFGWGTSTFDYDLDGDTDVIFHGGFDQVFTVDASNPGALLQNNGCVAAFSRDATALAGSTNHQLRTEYGVAVGDLDQNGFEDVVSVSAFNIPPTANLISYPTLFGGPFDVDAKRVRLFASTGTPGQLMWNGTAVTPGTLAVELNSGGNGNRSVAVELVGGKDLVPGGSVNRDGVGAVLSFTPRRGKTVMRPVVAGSSFGSQDSLISVFGLGKEKKGTLEILWPGGVRNRVDNVKRGEHLVVPEIPCSYDAFPRLRGRYSRCVTRALHGYVAQGVIKPHEAARLLASALAAHQDR